MWVFFKNKAKMLSGSSYQLSTNNKVSLLLIEDLISRTINPNIDDGGQRIVATIRLAKDKFSLDNVNHMTRLWCHFLNKKCNVVDLTEKLLEKLFHANSCSWNFVVAFFCVVDTLVMSEFQLAKLQSRETKFRFEADKLARALVRKMDSTISLWVYQCGGWRIVSGCLRNDAPIDFEQLLCKMVNVIIELSSVVINE